MNELYFKININFVNTRNEVVLNDERLLSLIQQYPFLYNPQVPAHNDKDYEAWAWKDITRAFNHSYLIRNLCTYYTRNVLIGRWKALQSIARMLSQANTSKILPPTLRRIFVDISSSMMEEPDPNELYNEPSLQQTLLSYEPLIKSLSLDDRRRLEAEMVELILKSELDSKATVNLRSTDLQTIKKDCSGISEKIALSELNLAEESTGPICMNSSSGTKEITLKGNTQSKSYETEYDDVEYTSGGTNEESGQIQWEKSTEKVTKPMDREISKSYGSGAIKKTIQAMKTKENVPRPLAVQQWVPFYRWGRLCRRIISHR